MFTFKLVPSRILSMRAERASGFVLATLNSAPSASGGGGGMFMGGGGGGGGAFADGRGGGGGAFPGGGGGTVGLAIWKNEKIGKTGRKKLTR